MGKFKTYIRLAAAVFIAVMLSSCIPMLDPSRDNPWDPQGDNWDASLYDNLGYYGFIGNLTVSTNQLHLIGDPPTGVSPQQIMVDLYDEDLDQANITIDVFSDCDAQGYSTTLTSTTPGFFSGFADFHVGGSVGLDVSCRPSFIYFRYWDNAPPQEVIMTIHTFIEPGAP